MSSPSGVGAAAMASSPSLLWTRPMEGEAAKEVSARRGDFTFLCEVIMVMTVHVPHSGFRSESSLFQNGY